MKINFKAVGKFLRRHSHQIAAAAAGVGVVVTAVEAGKAGARIQHKIYILEQSRAEELTTKEKIEIAAPELVTTAVAGVATVASVSLSAIAGEKMIAGAGAVAAGAMQKYKQYQENVRQIDSKVDYQARTMGAKEKVERYIRQAETVNDDQVLYFDTHTNQTFRGRPNLNIQVEARLRDILLRKGYFSENAYRILMGERTDPIGGDLYGWDQFSFVKQTDDDPCLKIYEEICMTDDGLEYHMLSVSDEPDADFIGGYSGLSSPFDVR